MLIRLVTGDDPKQAQLAQDAQETAARAGKTLIVVNVVLRELIWVLKRSYGYQNGSVDAWLEARRMRNRMIHKYVRDPAELAAALTLAHVAVPLLDRATQAMLARVNSGVGPPGA